MALTKVSNSMLSSGPASVIDFGADPTGVADSTAAITSAFSAGGNVMFPSGTYKISTTVFVENVNDLSIDAGSAAFDGTYGQVFVFKQCNNFSWVGGNISAGATSNPAYPSGPESLSQNFLLYNSNIASVTNLRITNNVSNNKPCITLWNMGQVQVTSCQLYNGGDNTIWAFGCYDVIASNNLILNQVDGRGICYQQVNYGTMTGNTVAGGFGDGLNVHGSSNISIAGNSVYDLTVAPVLGVASGVSIEWDENASGAAISAAVADPQLYNNVFSRNIVVSGNTISKTVYGVRIGNNVGITGNNYGNQGQVVIDGNNIFGVTEGIITGTSRQIRITANMISTCNNACIEINKGTDTGGYSAQQIHISDNRLTNFNLQNNGFQAIQFTNGTPSAADKFVLSNNEWDSGNYSSGFTNVSGPTLAVMESNTLNANGVAISSTNAALNVQRQFSDQAGSSALSSYFITGASNQFTQTGSVTGSFTTVLAIPSNASIAAQIQIGISANIVCFGTIYAHNCTTPALTFTGTGSGFVQLSGGNLQIKGDGTANGGYYSIQYSLLKPA